MVSVHGSGAVRAGIPRLCYFLHVSQEDE